MSGGSEGGGRRVAAAEPVWGISPPSRGPGDTSPLRLRPLRAAPDFPTRPGPGLDAVWARPHDRNRRLDLGNDQPQLREQFLNTVASPRKNDGNTKLLTVNL